MEQQGQEADVRKTLHIFILSKFGHLEEVNLKSADQCNGGVWEEPEEESEVHLEIYFFFRTWILEEKSPTMATIWRKVAMKRKLVRKKASIREETLQLSFHWLRVT